MQQFIKQNAKTNAHWGAKGDCARSRQHSHLTTLRTGSTASTCPTVSARPSAHSYYDPSNHLVPLSPKTDKLSPISTLSNFRLVAQQKSKQMKMRSKEDAVLLDDDLFTEANIRMIRRHRQQEWALLKCTKQDSLCITSTEQYEVDPNIKADSQTTHTLPHSNPGKDIEPPRSTSVDDAEFDHVMHKNTNTPTPIESSKMVTKTSNTIQNMQADENMMNANGTEWSSKSANNSIVDRV
mmetsp:Transcript_117411/g.252439  ORF Transcript_117411/g.252439 Transcript_117411/m.252439 type:complete len:238 (+) Transcript_117411:336-1049(+)